MSWVVVAKKDIRDALRSRTLIALTLLFIIFAAGYTYIYVTTPQFSEGINNPSTVALLSGMQASASLLIPLVALAIGYKAIVGERDSGSLKLLLGLPHTRNDVVFGKLFGRTVVVAVPVLLGFASASVVTLAYYDSFAGTEFVGFSLVTLLYTLVFVAIAVAFSSGMRSAKRALYGAGGLLLLFEFVWNFIPLIARYVTSGFSVSATVAPPWARFLLFLNPQMAYRAALTALFPSLQLNISVQPHPPFYLQNWFGFVILIVWLIVPLIIGRRQFASTDL